MPYDVDAIVNQLTDLEKKILAHIYHYGPDTPCYWPGGFLGGRLVGDR
ncbi:hypothetical protein [Vulcanisaeta distributa]|nr:hypothetical protein [Vulcanisaeta distributa]